MELVIVSQNGCNPCVAVKNFVASQVEDFKVFNISTDDNVVVGDKEFTMDDLRIMSTPVTILFDGSEEIARYAGKDYGEIEILISQL